MTGFSISATNHTSFTVSDLDRSLAYFCDVLGFELCFHLLECADLVVDSSHLHPLAQGRQLYRRPQV